MTNEAFLKNLQAITAKEQDAQTTAEFAAAFLEGCAEELKIYTMASPPPTTPMKCIRFSSDRRTTA